MKKIIVSFFKIMCIFICSLLVSYTVYSAIAVEDFPKPMPLISQFVPAYSSNQATAQYGNDDDYNTNWTSAQNISSEAPAWLAYDLSDVAPEQRQQVLIAWYNTATYNYDHTYANEPGYSSIADYTIDVNAAEGGTLPASGWITLTEVTNNIYHSRQHAIDMTGYNWIRIHISKSDGTWDGDYVSINMDVHDAHNGYEDSWLFLGDSITAFTMPVSDGEAEGLKNFGQLIHDGNANYFPSQECAAIGGTKTDYAVANIDTWLDMFPGKYVCLCYGTNDVNGQVAGVQSAYENMLTLVEKITAAGKVPVIPYLIWGPSEGIITVGPAFNTKLDELFHDHPEVIKGPDLWSTFEDKPELFRDELHPNAEGIRAYREAWAEAMLTKLYNADPDDQGDDDDDNIGDDDDDDDDTGDDDDLLSGYTIMYTIQNDWGSGATITLSIINNSSTTIDGWVLSFDFPGDQEITNIWNAEATQNNTLVTIEDCGWNKTILPGQQVTFGFNLTYSTTNEKPSSFTVNNIECETE